MLSDHEASLSFKVFASLIFVAIAICLPFDSVGMGFPSISVNGMPPVMQNLYDAQEIPEVRVTCNCATLPSSFDLVKKVTSSIGRV